MVIAMTLAFAAAVLFFVLWGAPDRSVAPARAAQGEAAAIQPGHRKFAAD
jgi:hypothetical protein